MPVFPRRLTLLSKLLLIDKITLKAETVAAGATLSHNIHICTRGVPLGEIYCMLLKENRLPSKIHSFINMA